MFPSLLPEALAYAAAGWGVLPCDPEADRAPLIPGGFHNATTDPEQITTWWTSWAGAALGAAIPPGGLVVDLDPKNGLDVDEFLDEFDLPRPEQIAVWSGRHDGGLHLYFTRPTLPDRTRFRAHVDGWPGTDVKPGGTGFMFVPPTIHPATREAYEFVGGDRTVWVAVPPPLLTAITDTEPVRPAPRPYREAAVDDRDRHRRRFAALLESITEGNRNRGLFDAVQICHRERFPGNWQDALCDHARAMGLSDREISKVIRSALGHSA